jgi:hypothetical protein
MDQELTARLAELKVQKPSGRGPQPLELAATFLRREGQLYVRLTGPKGRAIEHRLKALQDLYSSERPTAEVLWSDEVYLPLLSSIEGAIASFYREHPELTDGQVLLVLEGLIRRLEPEEADPLRTRIQDHLRLQLSLADWSQQEVLRCLNEGPEIGGASPGPEGPEGVSRLHRPVYLRKSLMFSAGKYRVESQIVNSETTPGTHRHRHSGSR